MNRIIDALIIALACTLLCTCFINFFFNQDQIQPIQHKEIVENSTPTFEYPLNSLINMEIVSTLGNPSLSDVFADDGSKLISVSHKITLDETTNDYVYTYHLIYRGKERCFLVWGLLDKVIKMSSIDFSAESNPSNLLSFPNMVELIPGEEKDFVLRSKDVPYFSKDNAFIYKSKDGGIWEYIPLNTQPGPLPMEKSE